MILSTATIFSVRSSLVSTLPVIHQTALHHLIAISNNRAPSMPPLPIDILNSADLCGRPPSLIIDDLQLHDPICPLLQRLAEVRFVDRLDGGPELGDADLPEERVADLRRLAVQDVLLVDGAAEGALFGVEVRDALGVGVLRDGEGDGGFGEGFAGDPAYALEGELGFRVVGEGLVLEVMLDWVEPWRGMVLTRAHLPLRLRGVTSTGALILKESGSVDVIVV